MLETVKSKARILSSRKVPIQTRASTRTKKINEGIMIKVLVSGYDK